MSSVAINKLRNSLLETRIRLVGTMVLSVFVASAALFGSYYGGHVGMDLVVQLLATTLWMMALTFGTFYWMGLKLSTVLDQVTLHLTTDRVLKLELLQEDYREWYTEKATELNQNTARYILGKGDATQIDSGYDLKFPTTTTIPAGETKLVGTGVKCQPMFAGGYDLCPRSSIYKTPLRFANSFGIIDNGYRGELMAALHNTSNEPYTIEAGTRLCQICMADMHLFSVNILPKGEGVQTSVRGEGGLGSTGTGATDTLASTPILEPINSTVSSDDVTPVEDVIENQDTAPQIETSENIANFIKSAPLPPWNRDSADPVEKVEELVAHIESRTNASNTFTDEESDNDHFDEEEESSPKNPEEKKNN